MTAKRARRLTPLEQVIQSAKALSASDLEKLHVAIVDLLGGIKPPRLAVVTDSKDHTRTYSCTDFAIDEDGRLSLHEHGNLKALFNTGEWRFLGVDRGSV